ncbi:MAG: TetR/AcrR family transcriptional regulator [Deltaproteobacteria bacterium]|nr:TetR/AcrR family transcriptional regulator [Deltaproteobacteria bacterium]
MVKEVGKVRELDGEVRQRLLDAATELFTRKGYAATTVREIVSAAGVTAPVLYYYFESKEGLYVKLLGEPWTRFATELEAALGEGRTAEERLRAICRRILGLFQESLGLAKLMYAIYFGPPQGAPPFDCDVYHDRMRETMQALVEEGVRSGELAEGNVDGMVWAVIGALNVTLELELSHPDRALGPAGLDRVLDVVFRGMVRKEEGGKKR